MSFLYSLQFNIQTILCLIIAYLLGSLSPAIIIGRLHGIDIKKEGSGNAGTTNVLRILGKKAALATLIIDLAKGALSVSIALLLASREAAYLSAICVFIGHIFPLYYKFRGGKGVAATYGALLVVNWRVAVLAFVIMLIVTLIGKRMSLGSIAGAASIPILALVFEPAFALCALIIALVIIVKHRSNIKRLIKGEEPLLAFLDKK